MNAKLKSEWVAALRSGKYEQGRRYLKRDNRYCCLGVLCAITGVEPDFDLDKGDYRPKAGYGLVDSLLHDDGMRSIANRLWPLNDNGMSFSELADYIEANVPADEEQTHD